MIDFETAIAVVKQLYSESDLTDFPNSIVLVGGSALAAYRLRKMSDDIDFFANTFPEDKLLEIESSLKKQYGESFKIDATTTENIWGYIMVRDIEESSTFIQSINIQGRTLNIKALAIEDLYLLKLVANRLKDKSDLPIIAQHTDADKIITRANQHWKNIGNRDMVLGILDQFVNRVHLDFGLDYQSIIEQLTIAKTHRETLLDTYCEPDVDVSPQ